MGWKGAGWEQSLSFPGLASSWSEPGKRLNTSAALLGLAPQVPPSSPAAPAEGPSVGSTRWKAPRILREPERAGTEVGEVQASS